MSWLAGPPTPLSPSPCPPDTSRVPQGVRTNLLTLQPALRTLTNDYNGLKRQVRGFPLLLQEALKSVKAEVSAARTGRLAEALEPRAPLQNAANPPGNSSPPPLTRAEKQTGQGRVFGICLMTLYFLF